MTICWISEINVRVFVKIEYVLDLLNGFECLKDTAVLSRSLFTQFVVCLFG